MPNDPSITLPPPFGLLDQDLVYITTGYNQNNCQLISRELSVADLRKYITGKGAIEGGHNIFTDIYSSTSGVIIHTTGLNAYGGNLITTEYDTVWPYSGIISTTGLNARTENLVTREFESVWPHSGVIYNTGLNARAGNNIDISYNTSSDAGTIYGGLGGKYNSGIISTTGLNATPGLGVYYQIDANWPYRYQIAWMKKTYLTTSSNFLLINGNSSDTHKIESILIKPLRPNINGVIIHADLNLIKCTARIPTVTFEAYGSPNYPPPATGPNGQPVSWQIIDSSTVNGTANLAIERILADETEPDFSYNYPVSIIDYPIQMYETSPNSNSWTFNVVIKNIDLISFLSYENNKKAAVVFSRNPPIINAYFQGYYMQGGVSQYYGPASTSTEATVTASIGAPRFLEIEPI